MPARVGREVGVAGLAVGGMVIREVDLATTHEIRCVRRNTVSDCLLAGGVEGCLALRDLVVILAGGVPVTA